MLVYGHYITLRTIYGKGFDYLDKGYKEYEVKDMIDAYPCVLVDLDNHDEFVIKLSDPDSHDSRARSREGMTAHGKNKHVWNGKEISGILARSGSIVDMAKLNVSKYKEMIAKKHIDEINDDELGKKVEALVSDVLKFVSQHNEDDKIYKRQSLLQMLYVNSYGEMHRAIGGDHNYQEGLLPMYNAYLENKLDANKFQKGQHIWGGADGIVKNFKTNKELIAKLIDCIRKFMEEY